MPCARTADTTAASSLSLRPLHASKEDHHVKYSSFYNRICSNSSQPDPFHETERPVRNPPDTRWSDWLPIHAWQIEHPAKGLILVDTGETSRTMHPGYLPRFHPYYRKAVEFDVRPEDEIDYQLKQAGIRPADIRHIILTHLHTDHSEGIHHFPQSTIWVHPLEWQAATGIRGWFYEYPKKRWPDWLELCFIRMQDGPFATFTSHTDFLTDGAIRIVPTPGHSMGHVSVIVDLPNRPAVLAGDASYTTSLMESGQGGATLTPEGFQSLAKLRTFVQASNALYLPTHEPPAAEKLLQV